MALKFDFRALLLAFPAMALGLQGCSSGDDAPRVYDIEAVAGQTFADASTLTFTVKGGAQHVRLNNVYSSMAIETRFIGDDGKTLSPGGGIAIKAGQTVPFTKDGAHVELIEVNRVARGLDEIELSFVFSDGSVQYAKAPFVTPEGAEGI